MAVTTESDRIERHRRTLLSLYLTDHGDTDLTAATGVPNQLIQMADRYGADSDWGAMPTLREGRTHDANPYISFDPETCILCARCVRYCDEVEGVSAITLASRGAETTVSTADRAGLLDTSCEMCGGCIDVCPTGAMGEKQVLARPTKPEQEFEKVRTTCNYCGVGCQLDLCVERGDDGDRGRIVKITSPEPGTTTNDGNLCVKGRFAYDFVDHPDRLTAPLARQADGSLAEVSWEEALRRAGEGLLGVKARHGADALGLVSSSRCTVEENYLVQKLSRAIFGTNNCHSCAAT